MQTLEAAFKNETIGLVTREQFVKKRDTIGDRLQEEKKRAREAEEEATAQVGDWWGCSDELACARRCPEGGWKSSGGGCVSESWPRRWCATKFSFPSSIPSVQERKLAKAAKTKRERKQKLSFGEEEEEEQQGDGLAGAPAAEGPAAQGGELSAAQASWRRWPGRLCPTHSETDGFLPS